MKCESPLPSVAYSPGLIRWAEGCAIASLDPDSILAYRIRHLAWMQLCCAPRETHHAAPA